MSTRGQETCKRDSLLKAFELARDAVEEVDYPMLCLDNPIGKGFVTECKTEGSELTEGQVRHLQETHVGEDIGRDAEFQVSCECDKCTEEGESHG